MIYGIIKLNYKVIFKVLSEIPHMLVNILALIPIDRGNKDKLAFRLL